MKKILFAYLLLFSSLSYCATITVKRKVYSSSEKIEITWGTASASHKDWIGIFPENKYPSSSNVSLDWDYVGSDNGTLSLPGRKTGLSNLAPGRYVAYLLCCDGYAVKARSAVFEIIKATSFISIDKIAYNTSEPIVISFSGAAALAKDWIGIYPESTIPSSSNPSLDWDYLSSNNGLLNFPGRKNSLAALNPGRYVAVLLCCDGYTIKAKSEVFQVYSGNYISIEQTTFAAGESIHFNYNSVDASSSDWIGIYKQGETPGQVKSTAWAYVSSASGTLDLPNPGVLQNYVAYLLCCDGYTVKARTTVFTVAPQGGCHKTSTPVVPEVITKIAFGSCASQYNAQPALDVAIAKHPDLFIYLGDNMYADTYDTTVLKQRYEDFSRVPEYCRLKNSIPIVATWDDHDMGANDEDKDYAWKDQSKKYFLDFFEEPVNSSRRNQPGIYTSYVYGNQPGKKVQVILLDLRYNLDNRIPNNGCGKNDYCINNDPNATMMGSTQWAWLEKQLKVPADLRIIGSSVQFGIQYNGWESWANFPKEREKMMTLIRSTKASNVIMVSGDVHWSELSAYTSAGNYPVYDFTSSGINREFSAIEPNSYRVSGVPATYNQSVGFFEIDWNNRNVKMSALGTTNNVLFSYTVPMNSISFDNTQPPSDGCSGIADYQENSGYVAGSKVKNAGRQYECKPFPYSGWCNGASWAYAPGTGAYWSDAWTDKGSCASREGANSSDAHVAEALFVYPNPSANEVNLDFQTETGGTMQLVGLDGKLVKETIIESGKKVTTLQDLKPGNYIIHFQTNNKSFIYEDQLIINK